MGLTKQNTHFLYLKTDTESPTEISYSLTLSSHFYFDNGLGPRKTATKLRFSLKPTRLKQDI